MVARRSAGSRLFGQVFSSVVPESHRRETMEPWLAATAISTYRVVNVSRAPGLCLFGRVSLVSSSFLEHDFLLEKKGRKTFRCCSSTGVGCLIEPVAVPNTLNESLFAEKRPFFGADYAANFSNLHPWNVVLIYHSLSRFLADVYTSNLPR